MDVLRFFFDDFWHFAGLVVVLLVVIFGICAIRDE